MMMMMMMMNMTKWLHSESNIGQTGLLSLGRGNIFDEEYGSVTYGLVADISLPRYLSKVNSVQWIEAIMLALWIGARRSSKYLDNKWHIID